MLTFMLTCDYLCLPYHAVPRPDPTAILTQSWCEASGCGSGVGWTPRPKVWWRSQVKPWRIVWQCEWKKIRASFQAQIPYKLQVIVKKTTSKSRGFLRPDHFWGMNQQFRCGENDIFFKTLKTLARFPPAGCFTMFNLWSSFICSCIYVMYCYTLFMYVFIYYVVYLMYVYLYSFINSCHLLICLSIYNIYIYATAKIQDLVCPKMGNAGYSSAVPDTSPWHLCGRPSRSSGFL